MSDDKLTGDDDYPRDGEDKEDMQVENAQQQLAAINLARVLHEHQIELTRLHAELAWSMYTHLRKCGFTDTQAMQLLLTRGIFL